MPAARGDNRRALNVAMDVASVNLCALHQYLLSVCAVQNGWTLAKVPISWAMREQVSTKSGLRWPGRVV